MLLYLLSQLYPATLPHGRLGPGTNPKVPPVHQPPSFAPFCPGVWVSPFGGSFMQSRNSLASYHIPATLAVSCSYTLFCATAHGYLPYSQWLPHSFYRHGGGTPLHGQIPQRLLQPRPQLPGSCGQTIRRVSGLRYTLRPGNSHLRAFKRKPWINA